MTTSALNWSREIYSRAISRETSDLIIKCKTYDKPKIVARKIVQKIVRADLGNFLKFFDKKVRFTSQGLVVSI